MAESNDPPSDSQPEKQNTSVSADQLEKILDERFDLEALAQMVEQEGFAANLSEKLTKAFGETQKSDRRLSATLGSVQAEIRELVMDVAMLKRALTSLGHVGVMERRRIEQELIRELFPPSQPRPGAGIAVRGDATPGQVQSVDCENRLHICKAACCRILDIPLTPDEVDRGQHDWDPRRPYTLVKNRQGCGYLESGGCNCHIYNSRPRECRTYSCANDARIWNDFENKVLNPELARRLETLHVNTSSHNGIDTGQSPQPLDSRSSSRVPPEETVATANDAPASEGTTVAPPDFESLRNLKIQKPAKQFTPGAGDTNGKSET